MKTKVEIVNEIVKVHDFSAKLFKHPLFKDKWYLHNTVDSFYALKRSTDCSLDFVSCAEIRVAERIASEFGFTFTGVSFDDGALVLNLYFGNLKNI